MADQMTTTSILEWDVERVSQWVSSLGLAQYAKRFVDNSIEGDVLMHLNHSDLREIGVASVGHRLRILKAIYELLVEQHIEIDDDEHYTPPTVLEARQATKKQSQGPNQTDIVHSFELRDERMGYAEHEIRKLVDNYHKLREDLLPMFRMVKESKPLPTPELVSPHSNHHPTLLQPHSSLSPTIPSSSATSPPPPTPIQSGSSSSIPTPVSSVPPSLNSYLSSASTLSSSNQPHVKKLISKSSLSNLPLRSPTTKNSDYYDSHKRDRERDREHPTNASSLPSDLLKSFRVSMDDPCYKVLPAAVRKYKLPGDPREYALLVCYDDQQRLLGLEEKPLIIYKELQDAGRKPVFMLRQMDNKNKDHHHHHYNQGQGVVVGDTPGGVL